MPNAFSVYLAPSIIISAPETINSEIAKDLLKFHKYKSEGRLLFVSFESVTDYLELLQSTAEAVHAAGLGSSALMYLAAAVSDFYLPKEQVIWGKNNILH
jgi:phosphopantothenate-cysteine ligase